MKLSMEQLKEIYFGALFFKETEDGYLQAFQYTEEQMEYFKKASDFWYERSYATTAKTLEFQTTATKFSFDYDLIWVSSEDSIELFVDGLATEIRYLKDIPRKGTASFALPEGEKNVIVYLPADATIVIRNFEIDGAYTPAVKGEKVLWMGDSITQGFGPLRSGVIYVSVANRFLNYDVINQGIGGYVYDKNSVMPMYDYRPDKIIVSLGTNQFGTETMKDVEEFYIRLKEVYKDTPVLCITPLWRGDHPEGFDTLFRFCDNVKKICEQYENITIVDGMKLVPHLPEYFLDNLHPNALGMEVYGRNLVEAIRKTGF